MPVSPAVISHLMRMRHIDEEREKERKRKKKKNPHRKDSLLEKREIKKEEIDDPNIDSQRIINLLNRTIKNDECPSNCIPLSEMVRIYEKYDLNKKGATNNYEKLFSNFFGGVPVILTCYPSKNKVELIVDLDYTYTFYVGNGIIDTSGDYDDKKEKKYILKKLGKYIEDYYKLYSKYEVEYFRGPLYSYYVSISPLEYITISEIGISSFQIQKDFHKKWNIICDSLKVRKEFKDKEQKISENLYISLNACPNFVKNELEFEQRQKEERRRQEKQALELEKQRLLEEKEKQERKDAIIRKIFPFYKRKKSK